MSKVSIIIPFYNCSYIGRAIQSALDQTYPDCEILVVNDGSDAAYRFGVEPYFGKIIYYEKPNGGTASALNVGLLHMTGDYFAWLSSDDMFLPDKIQKQIEFMKQHGHEISYTNYYLMNEKDEIFGEPQGVFFEDEETFLKKFSHGCFINGSSIVAKKDLLTNAGNFNPTLRFTQDYDMWMRVLQYTHFGYLNEPLLKYRVHDGMGSHQYGKEIPAEIRKIKEQYRLSLAGKILRLREGKN